MKRLLVLTLILLSTLVLLCSCGGDTPTLQSKPAITSISAVNSTLDTANSSNSATGSSIDTPSSGDSTTNSSADATASSKSDLWTDNKQ